MSYYNILKEFLVTNLPYMIQGMGTTISVVSISMFMGFFIAILAALGKLSTNKWIRLPFNAYVELFRGTPLLVQILFMSFAYPRLIASVLGVPPVLDTWTNPSIYWDMVIVLTLNTGAYQAEIIRAGIESIPRGQMEASRAIGLTYAESMRFVILPQAIRVVFPPLAGEFINLVLNSALVSVVGLLDLTMWGRRISTTSFRVLETWFTIGVLYYLMTGTLSRAFNYIEKKYKIPGLGTKD